MSFFDNKSGQHVGDGATAIQIAGNAHIGNTTTEVVTICELGKVRISRSFLPKLTR